MAKHPSYSKNGLIFIEQVCSWLKKVKHIFKDNIWKIFFLKISPEDNVFRFFKTMTTR